MKIISNMFEEIINQLTVDYPTKLCGGILTVSIMGEGVPDGWISSSNGDSPCALSIWNICSLVLEAQYFLEEEMKYFLYVRGHSRVLGLAYGAAVRDIWHPAA
jgi:hypothetical protein